MLDIFLKNKRVIIVGPSESLLIHSTKEFIHSFDIIVRINDSVNTTLIHEQKIGNRCDILYHCLNEDMGYGGIINVELLKKINTQYIFYPPTCDMKECDQLKISNLKKFLKLQQININDWNLLSKKINTKPNLGFFAIFDLLMYDIKELFITGFTFSLDGYLPGYKDPKLDGTYIKWNFDRYKKSIPEANLESVRHIRQNMFLYLKEYIIKNKDTRIKCDVILERILKLNKLELKPDILKNIFY